MAFWNRSPDPESKPEDSEPPQVELFCSFCGKSQREVLKLIAGPDVYICDECVELCTGILEEEQEDDDASERRTPTVDELRAGLSERVVGHEHAIRLVAHAVCAHRYTEGRAAHILLAGPVGCGKTTLLTALAELVDVPVAMADANRISATGYVGDDLENVLDDLVERAGSLEAAEQGIVIFDAVHHLARRIPPTGSVARDINGAEVQRQLVRLLDGLDARLAASRHPQQQARLFPTKKLMIVLCATVEGELESDGQTRDALVEQGITRELLARVGLVVPLRRRSSEELRRVAADLLPAAKELAVATDAVLDPEPGDLDRLAGLAAHSDDGAWVLKHALTGWALGAV